MNIRIIEYCIHKLHLPFANSFCRIVVKEPMTQDHKSHIGIQCMAHVGMANGLAGAVDAGKKQFEGVYF